MTTTEVAKRYFEALSAQDLDTAVDSWEDGGVDRLVGQQKPVAPDGTRAYFKKLFDAFPDFRFEVVDMTPVTGDVRRELEAAAAET